MTDFDNRAVRVRASALALASTVALAGCGGGGLADKIKDAVGASKTAAPATAPAVPAGPKNALMVHVGDATNGAITKRSPDAGSSVTFGTPGAWSEVGTPLNDANVPSWIKNSINSGFFDGYKVYKRTVNASLFGGAGDVPASAINNGTQYVLMPCTPGTLNCAANIEVEQFVATQGGVVVDEKTVKANTTPVIINGKMVSQDSWPGLMTAPLQYSHVGEYSDIDVQGLVTGFDTSGDPTFGSISGTVTYGSFFGGTPTTPNDMSVLKTSSVQAQYEGGFRGAAGQPGPITNLDTVMGNGADLLGEARVDANFGAATVTGNIYNLQRGYGPDNNRTYDAAPYGLKIDGAISGSTYSGTATYTAASTTAGAATASGSPTGRMLGGFFGPMAAETAGVVRIEGTTPPLLGTGPGTGANTVLTGGFGAKKVVPVAPQ